MEERLIQDIDCGNLPPVKAQQYLENVMKKQKNRLI